MPRQNVRQLWAAKLSGKITAASTATLAVSASLKSLKIEASATLSLSRAPFTGRVLGIDPSLRGTGLALIEFTPGRQPILLRCLTVKVHARETMAVCLAEIHRAVTAFVVGQDIRHVALEQTIFVQNFQTAQILGAARGAAIAAAALHEKPIFEYAPLRVKQAVVGAGRASKEQMARTVMSMLGHGRPLAFDEADAAGVALCHAFTWRE
jgi:crossover junction endodeoxyribonuclease RuvC